MAKKQELFIIVAGETPYIGQPNEREEMAETNTLSDLPTSLKEAKALLKAWQKWDHEVGGVDDPPMDFKVYQLTEVK